jgi:nucleoside-diphosphate-sugar epimerase
MHVLVIGGTRFVGYLTVWRLLARGDRVTLVTRGVTPDPFGDRVERLRVDRTTPAFAEALRGRRFDATVDFVAYHARDTGAVIDALGEHAGHYVFISTGQVYLVREGCPRPATETDYAGPVMERPAADEDVPEWEYGVGKRAAEDVLEAAWRDLRFPSTRLRIPMVNGERDYYRRVESYVVRLLDGDPVIVPDGGGHRVRHVYGADVAHAIVDLLGRSDTFGQAYNLAHDETPALVTLLGLLRECLGSHAPLVAVPAYAIEARGVRPVEISPFSGRWMSFVDPTRAREELGWRPTPVPEALARIVAAYLAHPPASPPEGYRHRALERDLVAEHRRRELGSVDSGS